MVLTEADPNLLIRPLTGSLASTAGSSSSSSVNERMVGTEKGKRQKYIRVYKAGLLYWRISFFPLSTYDTTQWRVRVYLRPN